jgi:type I restriction enzyme S subunit
MKEGWTYKKLGELALDMYRGSGIRRDQVTKDGIPCVRYGEIYTTYNISFNECVSHTNINLISSPKYFEYGDLLFAITGESVEDIGKTIAYTGNDKCLLGGDIICMKHNQDPKFMAYALSTESAIRQKGLGKTKLKVVHTNASALKEILIPLAPLSEQKRIVERLDSSFAHIDALKANAKKQLDDAKALFQKALEKAMEPKEGWEERTIGDLFTTYAGGTPLKSGKDYYEGGTIPWIRSGEVCKKYIKECELYITEKGMNNSSAKYYPIDTVLVAMYGATAAQVGILKFKATSNQAVCGILPRKDFVPEYIYYWFTNIQEDLAAQAQGGAQPNLSQIKIKKVLISYPPLSEQQRIVDRLDELSEKVKRLQEIQEKTIKECDALKQAILREVFE